MNKKVILFGLVVILLGVGAYVFVSRDSSKTNTSTDQQNTAGSMGQQGDLNDSNDIKAEESTTFKNSSIDKLLLLGVTQKCTYSDQSTSGTIYLAGNNRMRMDFTDTNSAADNGGMIMVTSGQYFWNTDTKEGIFIPYVEPTSGQNVNPDLIDEDFMIDTNLNYNFDCTRWALDESVLTPPADVKFTDLGKMMQEMQELMPQ